MRRNSWFGRPRRLSKDDYRLTNTEKVFIYLVGIRLLSRGHPASSRSPGTSPKRMERVEECQLLPPGS
jgi:hypothetical protein